ncbi:leucine-rich melanocyte differentiation-associated protein-like [Corticium candelabrum]|uniref:leucine-rich melanocyte differentiation-associated protein-like n=1 Tax=Corticium candelabrum TaxID=121492 RepID=UPI002E26AA0B|nr:leucine-rich melanocyte differentiation-associated protein-like [Corticium candelabrum]
MTSEDILERAGRLTKEDPNDGYRWSPATARDNAEQGEDGAILSGDLLTYTGQDVVALPSRIVRHYAHVARRLDLSYNCLTSVDGIGQFKELKELILDNNRLRDGFNLPLLPKLETLSMNKNMITNLESLLEDILKNCPNITFLSLLGNICCPNELSCSDKDEEDYQRYRYFLIHKLPRLKFLDSKAVSAKERQEAVRVGAFMKIVHPPSEDSTKQTTRYDRDESEYTPLPQRLAQEGNHKGSFGVCRYVYYGRHSEGNRFIRNNDL